MGASFLSAVGIFMMFYGLGMLGIRKLLNQNPKVKDAATSGVVSLITRLFRM